MTPFAAPAGDNLIQKIIDRYCQFLCWLMAASLAVMVVLVFGNAFARYAFHSGLAASEEISRLAFVFWTRAS